jgi:hypothetical protein
MGIVEKVNAGDEPVCVASHFIGQHSILSSYLTRNACPGLPLNGSASQLK